jgi:parallel beta-helix repeat protein
MKRSRAVRYQSLRQLRWGLACLIGMTLWAAAQGLQAGQTPGQAQKATAGAMPGPVPPPTTYHVSQKHPWATDTGQGAERRPFKTIGRAAALARPGDTVLVHAGIYRELVQPARGGEEGRPITYRAAPGERVVLRGSDVFRPKWRATRTPEGALIYSAPLDPGLFSKYAMSWTKEYWYTNNPFHTKIVISSPKLKPENPQTGHSQRARPWPPASGPAKIEDPGEQRFDADFRRFIFDGPAGTLPRTLGQVFVDGNPLQQVQTVEEIGQVPDAFLVSADGKELLVHLRGEANPAERLVEITTRGQIFAPQKRGLQYIHVIGFVLEHAANQGPFPQAGALSLRSGSRWRVEGNTIRYATTIGLDCGTEDYSPAPGGPMRRPTGNVIRGNTVSDNGLCGIAVYNSRDVRIENNVLERNNRLGFTPRVDAGYWEQSAIKLHGGAGAVIEGNLVRDNDAFGIWIDTHYSGARITRNLVLNNMYAGIMLELGVGPALVDNNVVAYTRSGHGLYAHDASGVTFAHNLSYRNAHYGVWLWTVSDRAAVKGVPAETSRNKILNNLVLGNGQGAIGLPPEGPRATGNLSDYNIVYGGSQFYGEEPPLLNLQGRESRLDFGAWQKVTGWDRHSLAVGVGTQPYHILRSRLLNLEWTIPAELLAVRATPVEGVERDYFGRPVRYAAGAPVGPFQSLQAGRSKLYLWPLQPMQQEKGGVMP